MTITRNFSILAPGVSSAGVVAVANGGTGVTTSTGSGNNVLSTSPTLVTPLLGTPTSGVLSNCTGVSLTAGVSGTLPVANGGVNPTNPTQQKFTSSTGTYTTPAGVKWIHVRMVGAGGGGAAPAGSSVNGSVGGNTTFGTGTASGGGGGTTNDNGGNGGAATLPSGATGLALEGGDGGPNSPPSTGAMAGNGGSSAFGGGGRGVGGSNYASGNAGKANTGGGGGGAGGSNGAQPYGAGGGGAGGYCDFIITSPSATYSYGVGAGGAGGNNGSVVGGAGGSGVIIVEEHYNY